MIVRWVEGATANWGLASLTLRDTGCRRCSRLSNGTPRSLNHFGAAGSLVRHKCRAAAFTSCLACNLVPSHADMIRRWPFSSLFYIYITFQPKIGFDLKFENGFVFLFFELILTPFFFSILRPCTSPPRATKLHAQKKLFMHLQFGSSVPLPYGINKRFDSLVLEWRGPFQRSCGFH